MRQSIDSGHSSYVLTLSFRFAWLFSKVENFGSKQIAFTELPGPSRCPPSFTFGRHSAETPLKAYIFSFPNDLQSSSYTTLLPKEGGGVNRNGNVNGRGDRRNTTFTWRDKRDRDAFEAPHTESRNWKRRRGFWKRLRKETRNTCFDIRFHPG